MIGDRSLHFRGDNYEDARPNFWDEVFLFVGHFGQCSLHTVRPRFDGDPSHVGNIGESVDDLFHLFSTFEFPRRNESSLLDLKLDFHGGELWVSLDDRFGVFDELVSIIRFGGCIVGNGADSCDESKDDFRGPVRDPRSVRQG